jgi:hypothetical protein
MPYRPSWPTPLQDKDAKLKAMQPTFRTEALILVHMHL